MMRQLKTMKVVLIWLSGIGILNSSCSNSTDHSTLPSKSHEPVVDRIQRYQDSVRYSLSSAAAMEQVKTVLATVHDTVSFLIPDRSLQLKAFPCSNCHSKPLDQLSEGRRDTEKKAHWDIRLKHGNDVTMNCFTCHNKAKFDELISLTGMSMSFNESYAQCAQCHSTQFNDWAGGAHGKRLVGWIPPKLMNTCTNCHNPHKPSFDVRWPSRLNTVTESKTKSVE